MRIKRIILEHHGDVAVGWFEIVDDAITDYDLAARNALQSGNHSQQGGFSAAGGADEHDHLAVGDVHRYALDGLDIAAINLADVFQRNFCHYFSVSTKPLTNQRCISTTTITGGMMARIAVTIT
ncbi:hypothetical protein D3C72_1998060 [compost metagenome]